MGLKDHYKTLGLASNASLADVKKAYRSLAHKYHPDKNSDNPYSVAHFREIQEAYAVLADEKKRKNYDEERYFAGLSFQKEPALITPVWLLNQATQLRKHMERLDSYTMNHRAVSDYVLLLLNESHLAVLLHEKEQDTNERIIRDVLRSIEKLEYIYYPAIMERLIRVAGEDSARLDEIHFASLTKRKRSQLDRYTPLIVLMVTLILCILMYFYSRQML